MNGDFSSTSAPSGVSAVPARFNSTSAAPYANERPAHNLLSPADFSSSTLTDLQKLTDERDQARDIAARLEQENAQLRAGLTEAAELIASWGAYASGYFQEKWDLAGDIARTNALAAAPVDGAE